MPAETTRTVPKVAKKLKSAYIGLILNKQNGRINASKPLCLHLFLRLKGPQSPQGGNNIQASKRRREEP